MARLPRLSVRGLYFLGLGVAMFVGAVIGGRTDVLFIGAVLIMVPVVAVFAVLIHPIRLRVTRVFRPSIVAAGADAIVSVQLRNLGSRPLYGTSWRDVIDDGLTAPPGTLLPALDRYTPGAEGGPDTATLEYTLTPSQRGIYGVGPVIISRSDPFGMASNERRIGEPHDLIVTPRITILPGNGISLASGDGVMHELLRHINPNSDELIAREYRPGDPLRRVNWPATARHGEIMVRQEEQRSNPEARIILDTTLSGHQPQGELGFDPDQRHIQAFELAIEMVASIGIHLMSAGFLLQLIETGPSQLSPSTQGESGGLAGGTPSLFTYPGGDRGLLEGLASVVPIGIPDPDGESNMSWSVASSATRITPIPTFAVLVDPDGDETVRLAAFRARAKPAIAFVLETVKRSAVEQLEGAGWTCIPLRSPRDIAEAWERVQRERGGYGVS
ncbi:DUF58 domain-containing protein [Leifsonia sp. A12D58]|uniref:DUF58 domain-containing protein n=1 Tax=Leifsonia sp. A12D58 TaxID=3397674 RepID=UPI0039E1B59E